MLRAGFAFLFFLAPLILSPSASAVEFPTDANIRYGQYAETVLDVIEPHDPALKNRPAVIFIHGGGWVQGTKEASMDRFCVPFLEHGFVVANVEYRLAKA